LSIGPGRKTEAGAFRKRQLSSDAAIILALIKKQPQTKEELCQNTHISDSTFYRISSFLKEHNAIKSIGGGYALWNFDFIETIVEDALIKIVREKKIVYRDTLVGEVGKPWPQIEAITYEKVKKLGLILSKTQSGEPVFLDKTLLKRS
jgi:hypothetical protein